MNVEDINDIRFEDAESLSKFTDVFIRKDNDYFVKYSTCTDDNFCTKCSDWFDKDLYDICPTCDNSKEDIVTVDDMVEVFDECINLNNIRIYVNGKRVK